MLIIKGDPLAAPDDATRLVASLWRLATGRTLGLYILAINGEEPCLGVHSRSPMVEETAADFVAAAVNGTIESGELVVPLILSDDELAAIRLYPFARHLRLEQWRVWGQQRVDPLKFVYRTLRAVEPPVSAGVGVVIKPLPGHMNLTRNTVFAERPWGDEDSRGGRCELRGHRGEAADPVPAQGVDRRVPGRSRGGAAVLGQREGG